MFLLEMQKIQKFHNSKETGQMKKMCFLEKKYHTYPQNFSALFHGLGDWDART